MRVREVLRSKGPEVYTIAPEATAHEAMREMMRRHIGALVVCEGGACGIITERDLLRAAAGDLLGLAVARVRDVMSRDVVTAQLDDTVAHAMGLMTDHRIRHLPIMAEGRLHAILSIGDIVNALRECAEDENRHLHAYIEGTVTA